MLKSVRVTGAGGFVMLLLGLCPMACVCPVQSAYLVMGSLHSAPTAYFLFIHNANQRQTAPQGACVCCIWRTLSPELFCPHSLPGWAVLPNLPVYML